jgi:hypothetical protein
MRFIAVRLIAVWARLMAIRVIFRVMRARATHLCRVVPHRTPSGSLDARRIYEVLYHV